MRKHDLKNTVCRSLLVSLAVLLMIFFSMTSVNAQTNGGMTVHGIYLTLNSGVSKADIKDDDGNDEYGDAVLLESDGEYLLIDTGSWFCSESLISYLKSQGANKLDVYVSHMHLDHMGGHQGMNGEGTFKDLCENFKIGKVYLPYYSDSFDGSTIGYEYPKLKEIYDTYILKYQEEYGFEIVKLSAKEVGDSTNSFSVGSAKAKVLGPTNIRSMSSYSGSEYQKKHAYLNNCSLITQFTCAGKTFLTGGDAEEVEEDYLVKAVGAGLKSDIYKANHHAIGSTSNCEKFMGMVKPTWTFCENMGYTEPTTTGGKTVMHSYTMCERFQKYGIPYFVAHEKKAFKATVSAAGNVSIYRGGTRLSGWTTLKGIMNDGNNKFTGDNKYYLDAKSVPYKGIRKIDGKYYLFGSGTGTNSDKSMSDGTALIRGIYDSSGYNPYRTFKDGKRYFEKSGQMAVGFKKIGSNYFYFLEDGTRCSKAKTVKKNGISFKFNKNGVLLSPKVPSAVSGFSAKPYKKKINKVSWKAKSGVTGYKVYRSTKKSSGYSCIKTISKKSTKSYSDKTAKSKKTYYYKVRAYVKYSSSAKLYGKYTKPVKVKTK